jgi:hypothetical protein
MNEVQVFVIAKALLREETSEVGGDSVAQP